MNVNRSVPQLIGLLLVSGLIGSCSPESPGTSEPNTDSGTPVASTTRVPLPNSHWHPPMPRDGAIFAGWLAADGDCVVLNRRPPHSAILWPQGWYAERTGEGAISVYTATGHTFATTGAPVGLSGTSGKVGHAHDACLGSYDEVWIVEMGNSESGQKQSGNGSR